MATRVLKILAPTKWLALLLALWALPVLAQPTEFYQAPFYYEVVGEYYEPGASAIIYGYDGSFGGAQTIPSTVNYGGYNLPIISIQGFSGDTNLTSVIIPDSITSIGYGAFENCTSLTSVMLGTNVTTIGDWAFDDCYKLANVNVPETVTYIGQYTFAECGKLTSIIIPNNVTTLGFYAFYYCSSLTNLTIGSSVTNLGNNVFYDCTSLTSVTIPDSVTSIGEGAFEACTSITNITIPNRVTSIGEGAFDGCHLTSVTIPNSVTNIGEYAFGSTSLTNAMIGTGITSGLGSYAFAYCYSLKGVYFQGNSPTTNNDYTVFYYDSTGTVYYQPNTTGWGTLFDGWPTKQLIDFTYITNDYAITITGYTGPGGAVTIPDTIGVYPVTAIAAGAFYGLSTVSSFTIPGSVTSIGNAAFADCPGLTNITVDEDNYDYRGDDGVLFSADGYTLIQYPGGLEGDYSIPEGVTSIGNAAFFGCAGLTAIDIPDSVTSIGDFALADCINLLEIDVDDGNPDYSSVDGVLFNLNQDTLLQYPGGSVGSYTISNSVTSIGDSAFYDCAGLEGVYFQGNAPTPNNDLTIFSGDTEGIVYYLPNTTGWGGATFDGLPAILLDFTYATNDNTITITGYTGPDDGLTIPGTISGYPVTTIGEGAFSGLTNLTSVTMPDSVTSIEDGAFDGCSNLTSVAIGVSVTSIGDDTFSDCISLTDLTIPDSVTSIGDYAFSDCTGLTEMIIPDNVTSLGEGAFTNCSGLAGVTIGNGVTTIEGYTFAGCSDLTSVVIGKNIDDIECYAFYDCPNLRGVYFWGDAPAPTNDLTVFSGDNNGFVYYVPITSGWGDVFDGLPTKVWNGDSITIIGASFQIQTNQFCFTFNSISNQSVVVEGSTNLANPIWVPLATNSVTIGTNEFCDPEITNYPQRFYRLNPP